MSSANKEQLLAISSTGGVILEAGAGSGKTFVIIEHIVNLVEKILADLDLSAPQVSKVLQGRLRKLVVMTFTKKAAREIKTRILLRIQSLSEQDLKWKLVEDQIDELVVTTIHGFCFLLIQKQLIPYVSSASQIISDERYRSKMTGLLDQFFEQKLSSECAETIDLQMATRKEKLVTAFCSIFSDPSTRLAWRSHQNELSSLSEEVFFTQYFRIQNLDLLLNPPDLIEVKKHETKKWFEFLVAWREVFSKEIRWKGLLNHIETLFLDFKGMRAPKKGSVGPEITEFFEQIKVLKKQLLKHKNSIDSSLDKTYQPHISQWREYLFDIFRTLEKRLLYSKDLVFSDLEYYVYLALEDPDLQMAISSQFDYCIVDEFQDTSFVQFEIMSRLVNLNWKRLFCVGDAKQAIYGFRGGELAVFNQCKEVMPTQLSLSNNYRSANEVIDFNNKFFNFVLPAGEEYEGLETQREVEFSSQTFPEGKDHSEGEVGHFTLSLPSLANKLDSDTVADLEAQGILHTIEILQQTYPGDEIAILYSRLTPLKFLIEKLIAANIGFNAEIKIPYNEDPILNLFGSLIEGLFIDTNPAEFVKFRVDRALSRFGSHGAFNLDEQKIFLNDIDTYGHYFAFVNFLNRHGISSSRFELNLNRIKDIIYSAKDESESILKIFKSFGKNEVKVPFRFGDKPERVSILTAHSSKGLEFDRVIVAGIYSNGRKIANRDIFGKLPGSFKWQIPGDSGKDLETLEFILEKIQAEKKEFAENKRLFYVACTRAVNGLYYVDLAGDAKKISLSKNSWIQAFQKFRQSFNGMIDKEIATAEINSIETKKIEKLPLVHRDDLGVTVGATAIHDLLVFPEVSVTRLLELLNCPRKFQFMNVLQLPVPTDEVASIKREDSKKAISSAERGTHLHSVIEEYFSSGRKETILDRLNQSKIKNFLLEEFNSGNFDNFVSERELKFSFLSGVINGIPDLLLEKNGQVAEIWDFKSGLLDEYSMQRYWAQLAIYGLAVFNLGLADQNQILSVKLLMLDQQESLKRDLSYNDCLEQSSVLVDQIKKRFDANTEHCQYCEYQTFCKGEDQIW